MNAIAIRDRVRRSTCRSARVTITLGLAIWFLSHAEASAADPSCWSPASAGPIVAVTDHDRSGATIAERADAEVPIWMTITLGTHDNVESLRAALKEARCHVGDLAEQMLELPGFTTSKEETEVDLAILSVGALGFGAEGATVAAIYGRAIELGLELCPAEVGPQLRLRYPDQPRGEWLHVAMAPMVVDGGATAAFIVGNGGAGLLLIGSDARADLIMPSTVRFIFVRPQ